MDGWEGGKLRVAEEGGREALRETERGKRQKWPR